MSIVHYRGVHFWETEESYKCERILIECKISYCNQIKIIKKEGIKIQKKRELNFRLFEDTECMFTISKKKKHFK